MVQTPLKFRGSVQSSLQPAGFVIAMKWTLSAAMCDCKCLSPGMASCPKMNFSVVFNLRFTPCCLAVQIGNSSPTQPVFCFNLLVQRACSGCKHSPSSVLYQGVPSQHSSPETVPVQARSQCHPAGKCSLVEAMSSTSGSSMCTLSTKRTLQPQF